MGSQAALPQVLFAPAFSTINTFFTFNLSFPAINTHPAVLQSLKMNAFFYAVMSLAIAVINVSAIGETMKCTTYGSGPKGFTCDDRPDIVCTEGCKTFITASYCKLDHYPKKPVTSKICVNGQGHFYCTGASTGLATCSGCVPYNKVPW